MVLKELTDSGSACNQQACQLSTKLQTSADSADTFLAKTQGNVHESLRVFTSINDKANRINEQMIETSSQWSKDGREMSKEAKEMNAAYSKSFSVLQDMLAANYKLDNTIDQVAKDIRHRMEVNDERRATAEQALTDVIHKSDTKRQQDSVKAVSDIAEVVVTRIETKIEESRKE